MMKRFVTLMTTAFLVCAAAWANEEYNITFKQGNAGETETINLSYGNVFFRFEEYGQDYRIYVTVENTAPSYAILLFKRDMKEAELKQNRPKILFSKVYPGDKGYRDVSGCQDLSQPVTVIVPEDKIEFKVDIKYNPIKSTKQIVLPIYMAQYKPKELAKKGLEGTKFTVLTEDILSFNIVIEGWSENDPDYVSAKAAVEEYVRSVDNVTFCGNEKHSPSLKEQQRPYQEKKDSLINVVNTTLKTNFDNNKWQSTDLPYQKYYELLQKLVSVNLDKHVSDCGEHPIPPRPQPSCSYCSMSASEIYHALDDMYQQLRGGKISKDAAASKAQSLYNCYMRHSRRSKDPEYTAKISKYYNRIVNY